MEGLTPAQLWQEEEDRRQAKRQAKAKEREEKRQQAALSIYYYHTDHLGTPRELTDSQGDIRWVASYKAWGNTLQVAVAEPDEKTGAVEQAIRFQGQWYDAETGPHYNRFRYYDPDVGRFISQDPIGLAGGYNLYQYVPNPVVWVDRLGLTFMEAVSGSITRTGSKFQGAEIYKFTDKVTVGDTTFRRGDYFYLDNLHKDHYETFSSNDKSKGVFNLDGTKNESKTKRAEKRRGPGCGC